MNSFSLTKFKKINRFTNDFRKKPPNTLEEKAKRFNDFTLTVCI